LQNGWQPEVLPFPLLERAYSPIENLVFLLAG
jgi:hypothetical protein